MEDTTPNIDKNVEQKPAGLKMPTQAALKKAATRRKKAPLNGHKPGRVAGLNYDKYAAAVVDLSAMDPNVPKTVRRVEGHRRRLEEKGYVKLEGAPLVYGFEDAEVWVKTREQWIADREDRIDLIKRHIRQGTMSDTALIKQRITGPNGMHFA
jgi:hypothetical protein